MCILKVCNRGTNFVEYGTHDVYTCMHSMHIHAQYSAMCVCSCTCTCIYMLYSMQVCSIVSTCMNGRETYCCLPFKTGLPYNTSIFFAVYSRPPRAHACTHNSLKLCSVCTTVAQ